MLRDYKEQTDILKFIASLLVVNGHLLIWYTPYYAAISVLDLGAQCVALFFFLSGYGLQSSFEVKEFAYLHGFLKKHLLRILIPLITAYIVTVPVYAAINGGGGVELTNIVRTLYDGGSYLRVTWYVTEIAILYVFFYVTARFLKRYNSIVLSLLVICLTVYVKYIDLYPFWFISTPCFLLGVWYQKFEKRISIANFPTIIISWIVFAILNRKQYVFYYDVTCYIVNIAFCIAVISTIMRIPKFNLPKRLKPITSSFYEIYLMQNCCFLIVVSFGLAPYLIIPLTFVMLIPLAVIMNKGNSFLTKRIMRHR